ncbi:MAG: Holliday junction resolvase RuvX [Candidatus Uhrbacteria bacterium]
MRLLGIDYGDKKIGLALGDSEVGLAVPLEVIQNLGEETIKKISQMVTREDYQQIVVGVPLSTGGHHGPEQLNKTRAFIEKIRAVVTVPVFEEDESYTSSESIRLQREEGAVADEDAIAAMLILEQYFSPHP